MQVCGYAARIYTVIGYVALWSAAIKHTTVVAVFTSYAARYRVSVS